MSKRTGSRRVSAPDAETRQQMPRGGGAWPSFAEPLHQRRGHEQRPPGGHLRWGGKSTAPGHHRNACHETARPGMTICRQATRPSGSRTQLVSTFEASRPEHSPATACGLPGTESVLSCSLEVVWLERTLRHSKFSFKSPDYDNDATERNNGARPPNRESTRAAGSVLAATTTIG